MINADEQWMQRAIAIARQGEFTARPNPCVGAVIVKNDICLGEGFHWQAGLPHAEVNALSDAKIKGHNVNGATCYVTLEPCSHQGRTPPCVDALIEAGIARVVIAGGDPNPLVNGNGINLLRASGIEVVECDEKFQAQAKALNSGFFSRMQRKKPWIRGKMAMSLDGRTGMKNGESQWITSENARADGQYWRARAGAVITTAATVIKDNARMTVRAPLPSFPSDVLFKQPLRIILDQHLSILPSADIFKQKGDICIVINETITDEKRKAFIKNNPHENVQFLALPIKKDNHLDLTGLWNWLYQQNINDVLIEAGPTFVGGMLQANIIDEMIVYMAPKYLGHEGMPMMVLPGLTQLNQHIAGKFQEITSFDPDIRLRMILE